MKRHLFTVGLSLLVLIFSNPAQAQFETDRIPTSNGTLEITHIGHGSLMFQYHGTVIHVDPFSRLTDYTKLPKADLILITHDHRDHFDTVVLKMLRTKDTTILLTGACASRFEGVVMENGDVRTVREMRIEAVPAYNLVHMRGNGLPFHPKGMGNGYVITFGDKRVYVAGDTENTPEMKQLKGIDIAFLPMNLPYTMTPAMVADAAKGFRPALLYPYHYGDTDPSTIVKLLKEAKDIEVRIRKME